MICIDVMINLHFYSILIVFSFCGLKLMGKHVHLIISFNLIGLKMIKFGCSYYQKSQWKWKRGQNINTFVSVWYIHESESKVSNKTTIQQRLKLWMLTTTGVCMAFNNE